MKRYIPYIICLCGILAAAHGSTAAQSKLQFSQTEFDYGQVKEDGGAVTARFEARNTGSEPVVVLEVMTSCGCTTPYFERKPIAAGETFGLEIRYDPMNRPGRIDRDIFVRASDSDKDIKLHITGRVMPRQKSIEEIYPFDMGGGLRLESNFHAFAYVEHGKSIETRIGYVNHSDRQITVRISPTVVSGALRVEYDPSIPPHASGDIVLRYRLADNSSRYGTLEDILRVIVDGRPSQTQLSTHAIAVDNFDDADDISAPRSEIPINIIKFGEVNRAASTLRRQFEVRNTGQTPLCIRKAEVNSEAIRCVISSNTTIAPGQSRQFTVEFTPSKVGRDGAYVARLFLITDDPRHPMQTLRVNAILK